MEKIRSRDINKIIENRYELVIVAAKRARQINSFFTSMYNNEGLPNVVAPRMDSLSKKPLTVAINEIKEGKVRVRRSGHEGSKES